MKITYYYESIKVATFLFYDENHNVKEEWTFYEKDFEKWLGTSSPTENMLHELARSYLKDWGDKKDYSFYRAYFEEIEEIL